MKLAETPLFRVTAAIAAVAVAHYFINLIHYCNKTIWNAQQQQLRQHWGNTEETIKKEKQHWSNIEASSSSMTQQKEQE